MKKILKIASAVILLSFAVGYLYRELLKQLVFAQITQDMFVTEDTDSFDPGPAINSHFPGLQAIYQGRSITLINEFTGVNGTVIIASRSFEWCPYCMRHPFLYGFRICWMCVERLCCSKKLSDFKLMPKTFSKQTLNAKSVKSK